MSRLDDAFAAVRSIHRTDVFEPDEFQYLTLVCVGTIDESGGDQTWAATFDYTLDDGEWYENHRIAEYRTAARGATPEDAILGAIEKFCAITGSVVKEQES